MRHALPALAALPFGALLLASCGGEASSSAADKPRGVPVRTVAVKAQDLQDVLALTGTLHPRAQVQLVAEVSAKLVRILKDEGAPVEAGETLAVLDATDYRLAHERARAAQAVAEANKAHAMVERERADNLLKTGGITDKDHLAAQVALQVAEAALAQAHAEVQIAAQQHARADVKAPFSGRVAKRHADPGSMLASGTPLFTLVDDSVLEFRGSVPAANYPQVRIGAPVAIKVAGLEVAGTVARVSPLVEERTRAFEVVVQVPGRRELVGGLFARAEMRVGQVSGALVVPPAALVRDGSDPAAAEVYVVADSKALRKSLRVGVETPTAVQVTDGLAAGEIVILNPPAALASGSPVEIQNGTLETPNARGGKPETAPPVGQR